MRKKNLPTLLLTFLLWSVLGILIYFFDPYTPGLIPLFLILIFITCLFTFSLALANTRQGLITASVITLFLLLRFLGIGHLLNLLLLIGVALAFEIFFTYH